MSMSSNTARLLARSGDPRATSSITLSVTGSVTDSQPNSASRGPIESCNPQPDEVVLWPSHSAIGRHCPEMSQVQCDRSGHSVPDAPSVSGFASVFQQVCLYRYPVHPRQAWDEKVEMCYLHIPLHFFFRGPVLEPVSLSCAQKLSGGIFCVDSMSLP